jgi:hypothetical protein
MKQAGLLERRRGWYAARIGLNLALLAAGPAPALPFPAGRGFICSVNADLDR